MSGFLLAQSNNCDAHNIVGICNVESNIYDATSAKLPRKNVSKFETKRLAKLMLGRFCELCETKDPRKIKVDFGNGNIISGDKEFSFDELAGIYLKEHYPNYHSSKENLIFVPHVFLTSSSNIPCIDEALSKVPILKGKLKEKFKGRIDNYRGDELEKHVYLFLKDYFKDYNGKVIVFHGYHLASRPDVSSVSSAEKDFIILMDTGYIINIECKALSTMKNMSIAYDQLKSFRTLFTDWFADQQSYFMLQSRWKIFSIIYCNSYDKSGMEKICNSCKDFICFNNNNLSQILLKIQQDGSRVNTSEYAEDLKNIFNHMLFSTSLHKHLVPRSVSQAVQNEVESKQSDIEVIQFFSFWTSEQLNLLQNDYKRVIFNSYWGTGKSKLLLDKAYKVARSCFPMDVLLFICHDDEMETLFSLKVKNVKDFQCVQNLQVICIPHQYALLKIEEEIQNRGGNCHVFIDEFYPTDKSFDLQNWHGVKDSDVFVRILRRISNCLQFNYFWIVIGGFIPLWFYRFNFRRNFTEIPGLEDFYIPVLDKPLRSTRSIVEYAINNRCPYSQEISNYPCTMACKMNNDLPPNLVQGTADKIEVISCAKVEESLKIAIDKFHKNDRILFITTRKTDIGHFALFIKKVLPQEPVIWGSIETSYPNSDRIFVENWLDGVGKYLLASMNVCRGFDYPNIVLLCEESATGGWKSNAIMRCTAHLEIVSVPKFS